VCPELLQWHYQDFGKTEEKMIKCLVPYLSPQQQKSIQQLTTFELSYVPFQWAFAIKLKK
jgi:hypothetical protein